MTVPAPGIVIPSLGRKGLSVAFDGGDLSSDAGLIPLSLADQKLGLTELLSQAIEDLRDPDKLDHDVLTLLRERIYLISLGYTDANDAQQMRHDPLLKATVRKNPSDEPLAGQSTLSRFENSITSADLVRLGQALLDVFVARCGPAPRRIVLDFDPFVDPCHGTQQGVLFNAHYDTHCYLPLYLCGSIDGGREYVVGALLRGGTAPPTKGARFLLKHVVRALRTHFPDVEILVRGDSGFGVRKMLSTCRHLRLKYCFGLAQNAALHRKSAATQVQSGIAYSLRRRYQGAGVPSPVAYGSFTHQAGGWKDPERIIVKCEVTRGELNPRFVVTNLTLKDGWTPRGVYRFYCQRGNPENRIKEFKVDLKADRLSCEFRRANQFRLILHTAAYCLYQTLQDALAAVASGSEWSRAQVGTIREKLGKVAARVLQRCRGLRVQLPTSYPWHNVWFKMLRFLAPSTG